MRASGSPPSLASSNGEFFTVGTYHVVDEFDTLPLSGAIEVDDAGTFAMEIRCSSAGSGSISVSEWYTGVTFVPD